MNQYLKQAEHTRYQNNLYKRKTRFRHLEPILIQVGDKLRNVKIANVAKYQNELNELKNQLIDLEVKRKSLSANIGRDANENNYDTGYELKMSQISNIDKNIESIKSKIINTKSDLNTAIKELKTVSESEYQSVLELVSKGYESLGNNINTIYRNIQQLKKNISLKKNNLTIIQNEFRDVDDMHKQSLILQIQAFKNEIDDDILKLTKLILEARFQDDNLNYVEKIVNELREKAREDRSNMSNVQFKEIMDDDIINGCTDLHQIVHRLSYEVKEIEDEIKITYENIKFEELEEAPIKYMLPADEEVEFGASNSGQQEKIPKKSDKQDVLRSFKQISDNESTVKNMEVSESIPLKQIQAVIKNMSAKTDKNKSDYKMGYDSIYNELYLISPNGVKARSENILVTLGYMSKNDIIDYKADVLDKLDPIISYAIVSTQGVEKMKSKGITEYEYTKLKEKNMKELYENYKKNKPEVIINDIEPEESDEESEGAGFYGGKKKRKYKAKKLTKKDINSIVKALKKKKGGDFIGDVGHFFNQIPTYIANTADLLIHGKREDYPPEVRNFLKQYGDSIITKMAVYREPIQQAVQTVANVITLGQVKREQEKLKYTDLFHVFSVLTDEHGRDYIVEKNQVIHMAPLSASDTAKLGSLEHRDITMPPIRLSDLINNTKEKVGMYKLIHYDIEYQNCQVFLIDILKANKILTDDVENFLFQNAVEIISKLPTITHALINTATDAASIFDQIIHGRGMVGGREKRRGYY